MTKSDSSRESVQELAAAIARLAPSERERLFQLLADRGDLPSSVVNQGATVTQLELVPTSHSGSRSPDYILTFDGGSRGNPGLGYGSYAVTQVQDGSQDLIRLDFGDGYTNNEAEYDTLITALQDLLHRIEEAGQQPSDIAVEVRGDSALVINQIQGQWKAKEPRMRKRRDQCIRLLRRFGVATLRAQPREESVRVLGH